MLTYSDECHHAAADSAIEVLQELTAQYVYGVTATPKRGDGKWQLEGMYNLCLQNAYIPHETAMK